MRANEVVVRSEEHDHKSRSLTATARQRSRSLLRAGTDSLNGTCVGNRGIGVMGVTEMKPDMFSQVVSFIGRCYMYVRLYCAIVMLLDALSQFYLLSSAWAVAR